MVERKLTAEDFGITTFDGDYNSLLNKPNLTTKQDTLVSGTNIKTINNETLLGSGNITIEGGSGGLTKAQALGISLL